MDTKNLFEKIRNCGLDSDKCTKEFPYDIIRKEEIKDLICQTLLESNTFPIDTKEISEGEGWIIKKRSVLGYYLIQYGERSMLNYGECFRKWCLTRRGVAVEYMNRSVGDIIFLIQS